MTRPQCAPKAPPLGSLRGTFPEEDDAEDESDRWLTWTQLQSTIIQSRMIMRGIHNFPRVNGGIILVPQSSESEGTTEGTTNTPSSASSVGAYNDWESSSDSEAVPRRKSKSNLEQKNYGANEKILYDACTIRTWFMMMDKDGDGIVSKDEFVTFLRDRPILQHIVGLKAQADACGQGNVTSSTAQTSQRMAQAVLQRRLIKLFNEIDTNKSKTMEFDEFLMVFRRAGYLLEYTDANNPRDRAAELLASVPATSANLSSRVQRCRRGSECSWAIEQQTHTRSRASSSVHDNDSPRRHSDSTVLERSPASFWEEPVVLNSRRPNTPWGRRLRGMPRPELETSSLRNDISLDALNASEAKKSSLWLRRHSGAAKRKS